MFVLATGDEIDGELEPIPRARVPSVLIVSNTLSITPT